MALLEFSHALAPILVCPACHADLSHDAGKVQCTRCNAHYAESGGVFVFSVPDSYDDESSRDVAFRKRYEWQYHSPEEARKYASSFTEKPRKRQRTRRELHILETLLSGFPDNETLLDVPCGGGRLSQPMVDRTKVLIEMDIAEAQLDLALSRQLGNQWGVLGSALALPVDGLAVDGAICARLSHHLPDPAERDKLLSELMRVAQKFVVVSFTDRQSVQSFGRKLRGKALNPCAMAVEEITSAAHKAGFDLQKLMTVSNIGPRHRYALLVRQ